MQNYDFTTQLKMSVETSGRSLESIIAQEIPGVVTVQKTDLDTDKTGIDYIATLRRGGTIGVDTKSRAKGASGFWLQGEELALEVWSVKPCLNSPGKVGWTLDEAKATDYTLHFFDPSDSDTVFLLPFHLLRKAFRSNFKVWKSQYRSATQNSGPWQSECIFVPATVVMDGIRAAMIGKVSPLQS